MTYFKKILNLNICFNFEDFFFFFTYEQLVNFLSSTENLKRYVDNL